MTAACASETPAPESPADYAMRADEYAGAAPAQMMPSDAPMPPPAPGMPGMPSPGPMMPGVATAQTPDATAPVGAKDTGAEQAKANVDQMIIFTGTMSMEVDKGDVASAIDKIVDIALASGGHVFQQDNQSVTVRVPSGQFRGAMQKMEKVGDVTARNVQSQDVTEEYFDLGVRLKSLHATRDRLQDFLEKAKTIEEVLRVEQELTRLNAQIDQLEGRMRFLATRASMSTITVSLTPRAATQDPVVAQTPPTKPRTIPLPIEWLPNVGIDHLLDLTSE